MIISKLKTATKFKNSSSCNGMSYGSINYDVDLSVIEVNGRYPDKNFLTNQVCKEVVYILKGAGELLTPDGSYGFFEGDSVLLEAGDIFAWSGDFKGVFSCAPAFYPEQHKTVAI